MFGSQLVLQVHFVILTLYNMYPVQTHHKKLLLTKNSKFIWQSFENDWFQAFLKATW